MPGLTVNAATVAAAARSLADKLDEWGKAVDLKVTWPAPAEALNGSISTLYAIASDLEDGRVGAVELQALGEALSDFNHEVLCAVRADAGGRK